MNETPILEEQRAGSLLVTLLRVAREMEAKLESELREIGLSPSMFETLAQLSQARRPLTMCELAEGQGCARSNITQKMDRLEREGFVKRVDDPTDRRVVLAEITAIGRDRADAGEKVMRRLRAEFDASLTESEREALERVLATLGA